MDFLEPPHLKYGLMLISRSRSSKLSFTILVNSSPLEKVKCFKYLALWITDDLNWSCHIKSVCCRARRQVGFIYRYFFPHCMWCWYHTLYKAHILPMLDYACIVCMGPSFEDQMMLESVQHFALKLPVDHGTWTTRLFVPIMIWLPSCIDRTLNTLFMVFVLPWLFSL